MLGDILQVLYFSTSVKYAPGARIYHTAKCLNKHNVNFLIISEKQEPAFNIENVQFFFFNKPTIGRGLNFIIYLITSMFFSFRIAKRNKFDVIVVTLPSIYLAPAAIFISVAFRKPLIVEIRDFVKESKSTLGKVEYTIHTIIEKLAILLAKKVIQVYDIRKGNKFITIPNGADTEEIRFHKPSKKKRILFVSSLYWAIDPPFFAEMINQLPKDITVDIVGDGPERHTIYEKTKNSKCKVIFHGYLSREKVSKFLRTSRVTLITRALNNELSFCIGVKTYEYMAAGRVVLGRVPRGALYTLINDAGGFATDTEDVEKFSKMIEHALAMDDKELIKRGIYARKNIEKNYNRYLLAKKFLDVVTKVTTE